MIARRKLLATAFAAGGVAATLRIARAQLVTGKVIKLIVPLTPGSPIDVLGRLYAPLMSTALGQSVIVENRPGAGTTIAAKAVASAEPDGHTLLLASTSHPISAAMYHNLSYDPFGDFVAVASLATTPWVVIVDPSLPVTSVRELVAYARSHPGAVHFGYGQGTAPHILGEAIRKMSDVGYRQHSLQGWRPGDPGHAGGPHPDEHRHAVDAAWLHPGGQAEGDRGYRPQADRRIGASPDACGKRDR
jgi:tripartite-type tricarboxylate transporter receptor subunit TctC